MNTLRSRVFLLVIPLVLVSIQPSLAENWGNRHQVVEISDARIKFEINSTDGDGGIQVFLDAEPWRVMKIYDPRWRQVFRATTRGNIGKNGGTELFLESGEPPFDELPLDDLLRRFPAGTYRFRGRGIDGEWLKGSAVLTHVLPEGPNLLLPLDEATDVDANNLTLFWDGVDDPDGSRIIAYQVLVVQPDTGLVSLPKVSLDIMMPPSARSLAVPQGFLLPGTEYEWEVLAIEFGGNQTLSSAFFTTAP